MPKGSYIVVLSYYKNGDFVCSPIRYIQVECPEIHSNEDPRANSWWWWQRWQKRWQWSWNHI